MDKNKTKIIIATNTSDFDSSGFEDDVIVPIYDFYGKEPLVLQRPEASEVTYETYKAISEACAPVLLPYGGDGTINWHLNNMDIYAPQTILAPYPAGTANDISTTLNGKMTDMSTLLNHGHLKEAIPISIEHDSQTRLALGYVGLGLTGICAEKINNRHSLKPSRFKDGIEVLKGVLVSKKINLLDAEEQEFKIRELAALNTRMASCLWPDKNSISIFDSHFNLVMAQGYPSTAQLVLAGLVKRVKGSTVKSTEKVVFSKPAGSPAIIGQADGEPFLVKSGNVEISKSGRAVKVLSLSKLRTKLATLSA